MKPHTNIITRGGGNEVAAWGKRENDGTVTVESQVSVPVGFTNTTDAYINLSHTEILQSTEVKDMISRIVHD